MNAAIVVPGTMIPGTTDYVVVEAGYADPGNLQLNVYDIGGNLLATRLNGLDGIGPHGRTLIILNLPGIRYFSVWTPQADGFGVDQIELGQITPAGGGVIPEPGSALLAGAGLLALVLRASKRRS